ncbi:MAG TPA: hypothetical protein VHB77_00365 [Planctomycetaceae bacterium]|nr:hypothetical protein [Planctomycetaceae bacterium]
MSGIQKLCIAAGVCGVLVLAGCGKSNEPHFVPVSGSVTLDGQPVHGARIEFLPDAGKGTDGPASFAELDEGGDYVLESVGGKQGALVGHHKVTIKCPEPSSAGPVPECHVPAHYANAATSELTAQVTDEPDQTIDFALKSK